MASAKKYQAELQGALKTKTTDPDVVGWFLGGQKSTRVGQFFFVILFYFLLCF
jgi:hypothetical protein